MTLELAQDLVKANPDWVILSNQEGSPFLADKNGNRVPEIEVIKAQAKDLKEWMEQNPPPKKP